MKKKNNFVNYLTLVPYLLFLQGCGSNQFKENYKSEENYFKNYDPNLIEKTETPSIYTTNNPQTDRIGLLEDGYIYLGKSQFTSMEINSRNEALKFAKEIGASIVLLGATYERTKKITDPIYPYYPVPERQNNIVTNNPVYAMGLPSVSYNYSFDSKSKTKKETITTIAPNATVYNQSIITNGKSSDKQTKQAINQQIWTAHNPNGSSTNVEPVLSPVYATILPTENREVDIYTYDATFWGKTTRPPALGIDVIDLSDEIKKKLHLNGGVLVTAVMKNSPALFAAIYRGDILISINKTTIITTSQIGELLRKNKGIVVKLELYRDGNKIIKEVKLNDSAY
ncbi:PDZ domain-containing protein [Flavobacterium sp. FlaQc-50]|jgi:hypothetical protein|uniref:PDZ domain-containing protein n=1 Tax=unclassified Flavobacterium TaxID=196869 RepID=UPI0037579A6C